MRVDARVADAAASATMLMLLFDAADYALMLHATRAPRCAITRVFKIY